MKKNDKVAQPALSVLEDKFARLLADYQNQEKRHTNQKIQIIELANSSLLDKLFPVIDDLERAQQHLKDAGLGHVIKQFHQTLKSEGLTVIKSDYEEFDPLTMDCAEVVAGPKNQVVKTILKGYRYHDKILRPAKVEVGSGTSHEDPAERDSSNSH